MNFKKPKNFAPVLLTAVGVLGGVAVGRMVSAQIPAGTDTQKLTMYKGGLALAGAGLAAFTDGNDMAENLVKGAGYGMFADQSLSVAGLNFKGKTENATINAAMGLGCGCTGTTQEAAMLSLGRGRVMRLGAGIDAYAAPAFKFQEEEVSQAEQSVRALGI